MTPLVSIMIIIISLQNDVCIVMSRGGAQEGALLSCYTSTTPPAYSVTLLSHLLKRSFSSCSVQNGPRLETKSAFDGWLLCAAAAAAALADVTAVVGLASMALAANCGAAGGMAACVIPAPV